MIADHLFPAGALLDDENDTNYYRGVVADHGCEFSPSCLTCPLRVCKHDDVLVANQAVREVNDAKRGKLYFDMLETDDHVVAIKKACEVYGITDRTMYRVLRRVRAANA